MGDAASKVMVALVGDVALCPSPGERPLVVGEASGALVRALREAARVRGGVCEPAEWLRHAGGDTPATAWPAPGPFSAALVRLPKGKAALEFALALAAAVTLPAVPMVLFGMNDEGIRSAERRLAAVADDVATIATRAHARVLVGRRRTQIEGLRGRLADWRVEARIEIAGRAQPWITYPGLFAGGRLDEGTALLLEALADLPAPPPGGRVLDYACGPGAVAAHIRATWGPTWRHVAIDGFDADALALIAAGENVQDLRPILGTRLADAGDTRYDLVVSNPPIHDGVAESHAVLRALIADAPGHLRDGGSLVLVVQRRVAADPMLRSVLGKAVTLRRSSRFVVLRLAQ